MSEVLRSSGGREVNFSAHVRILLSQNTICSVLQKRLEHDVRRRSNRNDSNHLY